MIDPAHSARSFALTFAGRRVPTPYDVVGSGPDALLLPALSSISARVEMRPLAKDLGHAYRCLVPDWPGFGDHVRARVPLNPETMHAFLDALLAAAPGPYALGVGAGHAAGYLVAAARRHPGLFARLVLVAPTWRGPLPTALGPERRGLFAGLRRAVELPLLGDALYRINISRPVIGRMMRAHVYADPDHVTPGSSPTSTPSPARPAAASAPPPSSPAASTRSRPAGTSSPCSRPPACRRSWSCGRSGPRAAPAPRWTR